MSDGALRKISDKFKQDDYDMLFYNAYKYMQDKNTFVEYRFHFPFTNKFGNETFNPQDASDILFSTLNGLTLKAYKRKFLIENDIKYSPTRYVEDSEFSIKAVLMAKKMSVIDDYLLNYRIHKESSRSTAHKNIEVVRKTFFVCEKIFNDFYSKCPDENLKNGFLLNRVVHIKYHYGRVKELNYKIEYYNMMRDVYCYINKRYGNDFIQNYSKKKNFELIIKNGYFGFIFNKFILKFKILILACI